LTAEQYTCLYQLTAEQYTCLYQLTAEQYTCLYQFITCSSNAFRSVTVKVDIPPGV